MSRLKTIREQQNLTQEELAEKSGISVRTIQRIESGKDPKGYTLRILAQTFGVKEAELLGNSVEVESQPQHETSIVNEEVIWTDYAKIKLINLSSIPFIILPPLNIIVPLVLMFVMQQKNALTKQIVSVQIMWTILAPILFMLGIFLKLGHQFTLVLIILIATSNVYLILINTYELDKHKKLRHKLNFNIL